jgi:hypothetical protein
MLEITHGVLTIIIGESLTKVSTASQPKAERNWKAGVLITDLRVSDLLMK